MSQPRAVEGEYKGHPTLTIFTGHVWQDKEEYVTLGLRKAKAVDDCIDALRSFVDKHDTQKNYPGRQADDKDKDGHVPF